MKKMLKSIVVVLMMCVVLMQGSMYLAASNLNLTVNEATKHRIYVTYTNAQTVSFLQMRLDYEEYDSRKGTKETDYYANTRTGGCNAISVLKENGGDISFTKACVSVKVNSSWVINEATIAIIK